MAAVARIASRGARAAVFVAAFAVLFWPTFQWMAERFDRSDAFYSHGWLIPLASAWLIWLRRDRLSRLSPSPSFAGLFLLIPSAIIHVLASWWSVNVLSGFAMVAAVWGMVWTLWGWQTFQAVRGPLAFLLFMVPLPGILLVAVSFKMKLAAAAAVTWLLHLLGIPAAQAGSMIHVPGVTILIDDTCSGLRSLLSLVALATLWAAMLPARAARWHRLAVVAASIPIALAANIARILILVLLAIFAGTPAAEGFIHYGSGLVVFGVALLALAGLSRALLGRPAGERA